MTRKVLIFCLASIGLAACQSVEEAKETDEALNAPINCATAEGDLRVLQSEQSHVEDRIAAGGTMVSPSSLYGYDADFLTPTADNQESIEVEVDRYQRAISDKIAEIKKTCGL